MSMRPGTIGGFVVAAAASCGCGGEPPAAPSSSLGPADRLAVLEQVVATVVGGVGWESASGPAAPHGGNRVSPSHGDLASSGSRPRSGISCEKSCDDATCVVTCPIDERLRCPAGGSARNTGTVAGTLDASASGTAALLTRQTYRDCRPRRDLEVDGDPETTASGLARFERGALAGEPSVRIRGALRYAAADGSGRCVVDLAVTLSGGRRGAAHGTACGQTVDVVF